MGFPLRTGLKSGRILVEDRCGHQKRTPDNQARRPNNSSGVHLVKCWSGKKPRHISIAVPPC
jgi:hypothetical protein